MDDRKVEGPTNIWGVSDISPESGLLLLSMTVKARSEVIASETQLSQLPTLSASAMHVVD